HGCIRLYPKDIKDLFYHAPNGTPVRIIYQPIKVGRSGETLYVEVHRDFLKRFSDPLGEALHQAKRLHWDGELDWNSLYRALKARKGIPVPVATR
ncbi:MAG TPA: L,D-transpeptidase family protein, partial [Desulfuromonadales bacterium]|nr:L,D-transpeptidase family protein [Desulfuromonadales bacterium]